MLASEVSLKPVEVFKAQALFGGLSGGTIYLSPDKWEELLKSVSLSGNKLYEYNRQFGDCGCSLLAFMYVCSSWFPLKLAWEEMGDSTEWRHLEDLYSMMEELEASYGSMSEQELHEALNLETRLPRILLIKVRLAHLQLGNAKIMEPPPSYLTPAKLKIRQEDLRIVLEHNPAWWRAHFLLGVALWWAKQREEAIVSVRRALMLNRRVGWMWCVLGRMTHAAGFRPYGVDCFQTGAYYGNASAALQYGIFSSWEMNKVSAFKLAVRLSERDPHNKMVAGRYLEEAVERLKMSGMSAEEIEQIEELRPVPDFEPECEHNMVAGVRPRGALVMW